MEVIKKATEILRKPIGWIELNLEIDLDSWKYESSLVKNYLVEHREGDGHLGWRSCCIHGIDVDKTGNWECYSDKESNFSYKWTEISKITPTITNFWKNFPVEGFKRLRFMELSPGGYISPHNDSPNGIKNTEFDMMDHIVPINIAITHPKDCYMKVENHGIVPWKDGKSFIINITNTHSVYNNSRIPRMHLIAHCIIGNKKEEFSELIVKSYSK